MMQTPPVSSPKLPPWAGHDGEWLRHPSWDVALAELPDPAVGRTALERLRQEFPPKWSLRVARHPVVTDNGVPGNRFRLLEMGYVLAMQRCRRVRHRLRDPNGYLGIQAELRGGGLLAGLGATLTHEPSNPRTQGGLHPDWHAAWPEGAIHAEVKLSRTSEQANAREVWSGNFLGEFQGALAPDVIEGEGVWATLHLSEALLDRFGRKFEGPHQEEVNLVARRAAAAFTTLVRLRRSLGLRGSFKLLAGCDIHLKARTDGRSGFALDGQFYVSNEHRIALRLRSHLKEAAEQLEDMPGGRVVLLDTSNDSALRRPTDVVRALLAEAWADRIAAVMLVYRHHPHCVVEVVPGLALDAPFVTRLITSKLRTCNHGHGHAEVLALCKPPNLSQCDAWE